MSKTVRLNSFEVAAVNLVLFILVSTIILNTGANALNSSKSLLMDDRLTKAYQYILSRYNPTLGLVSESEDKGINAVEGTTVDNTYWIYSDNLWAAEALQPYNLDIAENISRAVQSYIAKYGKSMLFEAALGEVIPTTIHAGKNIVALNVTVNGKWVQILLDRHQYVDNPEGIFNDSDEYADLCFYMTIDYWMLNDTHASEHWFRAGETLWNDSTNKGFYDKAAKSYKPQPLYQNMKLGLFLLAQRATGFRSNITSVVEAAAWSYQIKNGGIASLSYMNGTVYGTANIETTSALLLSYNDKLIERLRIQKSNCETKSQECEDRIDQLQTEIEPLKEQVTNLRLVFIVLGVATVILATISMVLLIRSAKARHSR